MTTPKTISLPILALLPRPLRTFSLKVKPTTSTEPHHPIPPELRWTPSSEDPNIAWTTQPPPQALPQLHEEDPFGAWTTAKPRPAAQVWTTFAPQVCINVCYIFHLGFRNIDAPCIPHDLYAGRACEAWSGPGPHTPDTAPEGRVTSKLVSFCVFSPVSNLQVTSNPWPSQFSSSFLGQVNLLQ